MKVKTSISLSEELIAMIDKRAEGERNRSAFIESAVRAYLEILERKTRDLADLNTINRLSERLNREALEVLESQGEIGS
jgi:metal-responsive CopG/Arc/MetJ family transcriptional regulator